jgi:hypothetical protein
MPMLMKKNTDLWIILGTLNLIAVITTVVFVSEFGFVKIGRQLISFSLSLILSYFVFHGKMPARFILLILCFWAGIWALKSFPVLVEAGAGPRALVGLFMSFFYLFTGIYLGLLRKWK